MYFSSCQKQRLVRSGLNEVGVNVVLVTQGQSLESIEWLFAKPWSKRVNVFYYIRYIQSDVDRQ